MISVIIPAYNEEKRIGAALETVHSYMKKHYPQYEILVIDDGSTDNTVKTAESNNARVIKNPKNMGKGYSVKNGMLKASGDPILFSDADLSTPIEELGKFMEYAGEYPVIIGSRNLPRSNITVTQPFYRRILGKIFPLFVNLLILGGIRDTQCGFKLFSKEAAKKIFPKQTIRGFGFDVEVLYLAKKYNYAVKELPVTWKNDSASKVSPIKDSVRMLSDLLKIKINIITGRY